MRGFDYVHVDVSGDFSTFGYYSTVVWSVLSGILIVWSHSSLRLPRPPLISLACSLCMVLWRSILTSFNHGPMFNVNRCLFLQPLVFWLGGLQLQAILKEQKNTRESTGFALIMGYDEIWWNRMFTHSSRPLFLAIALCASALSSALTMTGSLSTVVLVTLAYDEISWSDYFRDMVLPCVCGWLLLVVSGVVAQWTFVRDRSVLPQNDVRYDKVAMDGLSDDGQLHEDSEDTEELSDSPPILDEDGDFELSVPPEPIDDTFAAFLWDKVLSIWTFFARSSVAAIAMIAAFALGANIYFVPLFLGTMFMLIQQTIHGRRCSSEESSPNRRQKSIFERIDYPALVYYASIFVLVGSLNDTGAPQAFWNIGMGRCAKIILMADGACINHFAALSGLATVLTGPVVTVLTLASTTPYAAPYQWICVAWITSVTSRLSIPESVKRDSTISPCRLALYQFPFVVVLLFGGVGLIARYHSSLDCSVKLGECLF